MSDYEIGRGKPPVATRFKKGNREYLKRIKKPPATELRDIVNRVLRGSVDFREGGKAKRGERIYVIVRRYAALAISGDIAAAATLLQMLLNFKEIKNIEPIIIEMLEEDQYL